MGRTTMRRFESPIQTVLACGDQVGLGTCLFYGEKVSLDFFGLSGTAACADCSEPPCPMPSTCGCRCGGTVRFSVRYNKELETLHYLAGQGPKSAGCRAEQGSGLRGARNSRHMLPGLRARQDLPLLFSVEKTSGANHRPERPPIVGFGPSLWLAEIPQHPRL